MKFPAQEDEVMRRFWMVGMGGAALFSGWSPTDVARAGDQQWEVVRPGKRVEVLRMLGGGGRLGVSLRTSVRTMLAPLGCPPSAAPWSPTS